MQKRRLIAWAASLMLAMGLVPGPALAEIAAEVQTATPAVAWRTKADESWSSAETKAEAERLVENRAASVASDETEPMSTTLARLELELRNADGSVACKARAEGEDELSDWPIVDDKGQTEDVNLVDVQLRLTGAVAKTHDIWYRVLVDDGWTQWVANGESVTSDDADNAIQDIQVVLQAKQDADVDDAEASAAATSSQDVNKTEDATASTPEQKETKAASANDETDDAAPEQKDETSDAEATLTEQAVATPVITYDVHVENIGWQDAVKDGAAAGTSGQSLRLEAMHISLSSDVDGGVTYRTHVQNIGWQDWKSDGQMAGTSGQSLRLEAVEIALTGKLKDSFDIYYCVHAQNYGWLNWAKNGETAGTTGLSLRLEALCVKLVPKGDAAPKPVGTLMQSHVGVPQLLYKAHVQNIGWQDWVGEGKTAGTSGQSLRVEALEAKVESELSGTLQLNAHVQNIGWQDSWGGLCGTSGQSLRVEAFKARLTDELAEHFDLYYRVHAQDIGWMGWASNGASAGTSGLSLRLEAIELRIVQKGEPAPGSTDNSYIDGSTVGKLGYQNPPGFYQVSSKNVTLTTNAAFWPHNYITPSRIGVWATREECVDAFIQRAREYIGTPYKWDYSSAPGVGVDCIGLVYQCAYACGMDLGGGTGANDFNPWAHWSSGSSGWHSHDANNFWNYGRAMHVPVSSKRPGDVLWWPGHAAIYIGNNTIIEAYTPATGTIYTNLSSRAVPGGCIRLFQ